MCFIMVSKRRTSLVVFLVSYLQATLRDSGVEENGNHIPLKLETRLTKVV